MKSYLFYDTETTGLNPAFDQVIQFAAIRTDEQLNEIERHSFLIRQRPDVIPSPAALITHRIPVSDTLSARTEYEAISFLFKLFNTPDTISVGYNSLNFDDQFMRFAFYRNLFDPYQHQYKDGCGRMDIFPITILYRLFRPELLTWPERDGNPSMKLEDLSDANELATGRAHDALVDVEATVELARRFAKDERMWRYCKGFFEKRIDIERMEKLDQLESGGSSYPLGLMINGRFGYNRHYQVPVLGLGRSKQYKNQTIWLRLDDKHLTKLTWAKMGDTQILRKRDGDLPVLLPQSRMTAPPKISKRVQRNLEWCHENPQLLASLASYYADSDGEETESTTVVDVDAALYQVGFMSRIERQLATKFHSATLPDKMRLVERFSSAHTRELAIRILGRNFGKGTQFTTFKQFIANARGDSENIILLDHFGQPRYTPSDARIDLEEWRSSGKLDAEQLGILDQFEGYLNRQFPILSS